MHDPDLLARFEPLIGAVGHPSPGVRRAGAGRYSIITLLITATGRPDAVKVSTSWAMSCRSS